MDQGTTQHSRSASGQTASSLGLCVPDQEPAPNDSFLLDPRETEQWIASLPMANIGETARQIYRTLLDFNHFELPELVRAKVVELFRHPVEYICQNLHRHYMDMPFPLSNKAWKTAILSRELNGELAIAYKIIIARMLDGRSDRFDRKLLVISLHRTLHYLGQVMLQSHLTYADVQPSLWQELNNLFDFARQNRVHQVPIKMKFDDREEISTIEDRYKSLLLMTAASPHRLRQTHLVLLSQQLADWVSATELAPVRESSIEANGCFSVDLGASHPPVHSKLRPIAPGPKSMTLDLRPLLKQLRAEFEQESWEGGPDPKRRQLPRPMLRQLIINWNRPPERRFVRTRLNFELQVTASLQNIHRNLGGPESQVPGIQTEERPAAPEPGAAPYLGAGGDKPAAQPSFAHIDVSSLSLAPMDADSSFGSDSSFSADSFGVDSFSTDSFNADSLLDMSPFSLHNDGPSSEFSFHREASPAPANAPQPTYSVRTENESAGGYCIDWSAIEGMPKVKVGELIGIASSTERQQYSLGVARWLSVDNSKHLHLGLQILASHVEAAQVSAGPGTPKRNAPPPANCLVLPAMDNEPDNDTPRMVLASASHPVGTTLTLHLRGAERVVKLTRMLELSSAFALYQFSYEDKQSTQEAGREPADDTNFDDLWGNL